MCHDSFLILSLYKSRTYLLTYLLAGARHLELNVNDGLAWPYGLHLDENRRRLYVTEWNHGRILRVDLP